jgi:hypothetical protein
MSPEQQLTLAAIVAGALVSIGVALIASFGGWRDRANRSQEAERDREQALQLAHDEREHTLALAREERRVERMRAVYVELAPILEAWRDQVRSVEPPAVWKPVDAPADWTPPQPDLPAKEVMRRELARARIAGSPALVATLDKLDQAMLRLLVDAGAQFRLRQELQDVGQRPGLGDELREVGHAVAADKIQAERLIDAAINQMRDDLGQPPLAGGR